MSAAAIFARQVNLNGLITIAGPFMENANTISTDYTITTGTNALIAGPITINTGITVTVPSNSTWTIV